MSSKRKNPLQNLDDFLKQEASTLVTPRRLEKPLPPSLQHEEQQDSATPRQDAESSDGSPEQVLLLLQELADKNGISIKEQLMALLRQVLESEGLDSSKDKLLMNTLLYLQDTDNWHEKIAKYWSERTVITE